MTLEARCENRTPFETRCLPMIDRHGRRVAVTIVKATFAVSRHGEVTLAADPAPVRLTPSPTPPLEATAAPRRSPPGAPAVLDTTRTSARYPSDLVDEKPGTDVLLVGTAHPPQDRGVTEMDVTLRVAAQGRLIEKTVRVHGPRVWVQGMLGVAPGPAAELCATPLVYELTYGGSDESRNPPVIEPRNPVGMGFAIDRNRISLIGTPAPPIEDPAAPLSSRSPAPAGFGPIDADWKPRCDRIGTCDAGWARERAPLRPIDFDPRHNAVAPADLWSEAPLAGDEPVEVLGATPEGAWRFRLPRVTPLFSSVERGVRREHETHLDTFLVDADAGQVELTFRTSFELPRKSEHVEAIRIYLAEDLPDSILAELEARMMAQPRQEAR